MKIIGDIHGRDIWKSIVEKGNEKIIFLGDYFDSFDIPPETQLSNFLDIMEYQNSNKNCICLIGNHDYHYLFNFETYSGYNAAYSFTFKHVLDKAFKEGKLQACHIQDKTLFSHAGVSETWLKNSNLIDSSNLEQDINDLMIFKPLEFAFKGRDPYGDSIVSSPLWIRPNSLKKDAIEGYTQVVGHTEVKGIQTHKKLWFIDSLSVKEYLVIDNGNFKIEKINYV